MTTDAGVAPEAPRYSTLSRPHLKGRPVKSTTSAPKRTPHPSDCTLATVSAVSTDPVRLRRGVRARYSTLPYQIDGRPGSASRWMSALTELPGPITAVPVMDVIEVIGTHSGGVGVW